MKFLSRMRTHKYIEKVYQHRMIEKLSSQYYVGQLYIEPTTESVNYGFIGREDYEKLKEELYGETLLEPPLVMKVEKQYIRLKPSETVPHHSTQIPKTDINAANIETVPSLEEVLFPTKKAVEQFNKMGFIPE